MKHHEAARTDKVGGLQSNFLLSQEEACTLLGGICKRTLYKFRITGQLPEIRIGRKILFKPTDVEAFIENRSSYAASKVLSVERLIK